MRVALALVLVVCGCASSRAVAPAQLDGGEGEQAGPDGGSLDGPKISLARVCSGFITPDPAARLCRSTADCRGPREICWGPSDRVTGGFGCGEAPPSSNCLRDVDCKLGEQCLRQRADCNYFFALCKPSSCAQAGCSKEERCRVDGHCEIIPCAEGWDCGPAYKCNADPMAAMRDAHGCVPRLCTEGFTCPAGKLCEVGGFAADAWGCRIPTCVEKGGAPCPEWQRCQSMTSGTKTVGMCASIACGADADCPCGTCVNGACDQGPGTCQPPLNSAP